MPVRKSMNVKYRYLSITVPEVSYLSLLPITRVDAPLDIVFSCVDLATNNFFKTVNTNLKHPVQNQSKLKN